MKPEVEIQPRLFLNEIILLDSLSFLFLFSFITTPNKKVPELSTLNDLVISSMVF